MNLCAVSGEKWNRYRPYCMMAVMGVLFCLLALFIFATATEDGFGAGINNYGDSLYFLWVTTSTIGNFNI